MVPVEDRQRLLNGSLSLGELLSRHGLALRADLLTPWARWITPEISPRRFDTWFFAAALPPGQLAVLPSGRPGASQGRARGVQGGPGGCPPRGVGGMGPPMSRGGLGGSLPPR